MNVQPEDDRRRRRTDTERRETAPEGWYPDPTGQLRQWDGYTWSERVLVPQEAPLGAWGPPSDASRTGALLPERQPSPPARRWLQVVLGSVAAALVLAAVGAGYLVWREAREEPEPTTTAAERTARAFMESVRTSEDTVACDLMGEEFRRQMGEYNRSCDDGSLDVGLFGAGVDTWTIKEVSFDDGTASVLTRVVTDAAEPDEFTVVIRLDRADDDWQVSFAA